MEKEHQSLLKQIKRKQTELKRFVEEMRSFATQIFQRVAPNFQKVADLDQEIHTLFDEIFKNRKFGKQTQRKIEAIYLNLQSSGIISPKRQSEDDTELDELFQESEQEHFFSGDTNPGDRHEGSYQELGSTAVGKTEDSRKVRQIFLRLAEIFHPDRVTDSETQMNHTEIMKEINKAYQEGDLARLLEIERKHQAEAFVDINNEDDLTRRCKNLEQQNELLKTQYERLKRELRLAKKTPEGQMVSDSRKAAKQGVDSVGLMVTAMESQIETVSEVRDFIKDFREQKMTITEFLKGPVSLRSLGEDILYDLLLEELLGELGML